MTKPFLTYEQQLHKLINEKHLIIKDMDFAKQKLCDIGYFSLIDGYKTPFRDLMTRIYNGSKNIYPRQIIVTSPISVDLTALLGYNNQYGANK